MEMITVFPVVIRHRKSYKTKVEKYYFKTQEGAHKFELEQKMRPLYREIDCVSLSPIQALTTDQGQTVIILPKAAVLY
jgi:hypothetical protein